MAIGRSAEYPATIILLKVFKYMIFSRIHEAYIYLFFLEWSVY